jgi:hypothetical protein
MLAFFSLTLSPGLRSTLALETTTAVENVQCSPVGKKAREAVSEIVK